MKLELGKKYLLKNGDIIKVLHICENPIAEHEKAICVNMSRSNYETAMSFTIDGKFGHGDIGDWNVEAEIIDETPFSVHLKQDDKEEETH